MYHKKQHSKITILFLLCFVALTGCHKRLVSDEEGQAVHLSPHFATAAGKATETGFQTGDQVGLYATYAERLLDAEGNLIENATMEATETNGVVELRGKPELYYPSTSDAVRIYAYYPYQPTVASPRAVGAAVAADQSLYADYTASDWCWGTLSTTPSQSATPILFAHRTAQFNLSVSLPASGSVGGKMIDRIVSASLLGVLRSGSFDVSNGGWSDLTQSGEVVLYRPNATATQFLGMVPAQTSEAGHVLGSVLIRYDDQTTEAFDFTPVDPINFQMGRSTTVGMSLNDKGIVSVDAVQVDEWVGTQADGAVVDPILNSFTAHWRLPHRYWARVSRVELLVALPSGGTKSIEASNVRIDTGGEKTAASYTFDVSVDQTSGLAYPYTVQAVRFYDGTDELQTCASLKGSVVYRSGAYTIGVEQDRLLAIRSGVVSDWNELLYGDRLKGVDNTFAVQLLEYPSYAQLGGVRLTIDGRFYTFDKVSAIAGSHSMLSQTSEFRFPDANGKAPYKYPFVVEGIVLLDGSGAALGDGVYGSSIRVNRSGPLTMQLYRGVLSALSTTVTGYHSSPSAGQPEYGGSVTTNPFRIVYCDGAQGASCSSVSRVDLAIGGREVVLTGYSMSGTRFAAQSRAPHIDIVSGGSDRPLVYPYSITAIKLKTSDGSLLAAASFADPLVVNWWGEVSIELMREMTNAVHVEQRPTPADYVEVGGLRWAVGNLVAVDERNCRVGAPADGGVYFQFGSLIGYKGGAAANGGTGVGIPQAPLTTNGTYWNGSGYTWASDAMVWPTELVGTKTSWTNKDAASVSTLSDYYFNYSVAPWETVEQNIRDFAVSITGDAGTGTLATGRYAPKGVGDPCSYYLGDPWRLPTSAEIKAMCNNQGGYNVNIGWAAAGASWTSSPVNGGNFSSSKLFFPASGFRDYSNGAFYRVTASGYYWSSSVYIATHGLYLGFESSWVYPQYNHYRSYGFSVRCVAEAPKAVHTPTANDYVEIDMGAGKKLKWAKGNLIAANSRGCKVGAPNDGGVYFQFGSLIGWKGGSLANNGNGKGIPNAAWDKKYWNGAAEWSWNNDVVVVPTEMVGKPSAYPNNNAANTDTFNDFYFNYSKAPYATPLKNMRDYPGLATGALASKGVGDACSYYLGGTWRLPTNEEFKILCKTTGTIADNTALPWANGGGSWSTYNGITGGYLSNNRLFFSGSGWRYDSGYLMATGGLDGYHWSSTISGPAGGFIMAVGLSQITLQSQYARSVGLTVRCVSE